MTQNTEHFYAVQSFLEDDELHKIWNIIEIAMEREGYDVSNAELSMKLYDILRDMDFELSETQVEVFEKLQDAEVNAGFF